MKRRVRKILKFLHKELGRHVIIVLPKNAKHGGRDNRISVTLHGPRAVAAARFRSEEGVASGSKRDSKPTVEALKRFLKNDLRVKKVRAPRI